MDYQPGSDGSTTGDPYSQAYPASGPTGIPDPNNPGYDTAGYPLPRTGAPTARVGGVADPGLSLTPSPTGGQVTGTAPPASTSGGDGLVNPFTGPAPSYLGAPSFTPPNYQPPPAFSLPSGQDVLTEDPSYGFRVGQGEQALQNSSAAGGVLNTGNTLKDILGYGQNFASQEYGNAVGRRLSTYNTNYQSQYLDPYKFAYQGALDAFAPKLADWSAHNNFDWTKYLSDYTQFRNRQLDTVNANAGTGG